MNVPKIVLSGLLCWAAWHVHAQQPKSGVAPFTADNAANFIREDELVVLPRSFAAQKIALQKDEVVLVKYKGIALPVQYDDLDNDGSWDEAVFLFTFKPKERVHFTMEASETPAQVKPVVRAHVRHRRKLPDDRFGDAMRVDTMPHDHQPTDFTKQKLPAYLTEGPAWENDKVGFRKYFDVRNANDIWGKTTPEMVLDRVGVHPDSNYHQLNWWGMDILKVGRSLGAGAIALKIPLKEGNKDTLLRMGSDVAQVIYRVLADGPVRAMFMITYNDRILPGYPETVTVTEKISIWGGQYFFQNEVSILNAPEGTKLVTGFPDLYGCAMDSVISAEGVTLYSLGMRSESKDTLALAVMVPAKNFHSMTRSAQEHSDITNAFLISQHARKNQTCTYRFFAFWQGSGKVFNTKHDMEAELQLRSSFMHSPIYIE
ncbi:MAG TPA: DUF4861 family protein [Phnomibacter sp.]|nr:DUF4861 family protein [Phnomibacter sp.]